MSHARIFMPEDELTPDAGGAAAMANGFPAGRAMPAPSTHLVEAAAPEPAPGRNDVKNPEVQRTARLFVEFNTSAEGLMSPMNKHQRVFDVGANAANIFDLPKGADPNMLKSTVMVRLGLGDFCVTRTNAYFVA